jgi:Fic-DOC domain mobile mystery protein B
VSIHDVQYGSTPIDPDAYEFLTPEFQSLRTLNDLNRAEAANIRRALRWIDQQTPSSADLLTQHYLRNLHLKMFSEVWTWAGKLRTRQTNIGIDPALITERWQVLVGNVQFQIETESIDPIEIGVRFHTQMVAIHCFTNGNGRHARLAANKLGEAIGLGPLPYTWGQRSNAPVEDKRLEYLAAIKHAEATDDYVPLIAVALS